MATPNFTSIQPSADPAAVEAAVLNFQDYLYIHCSLQETTMENYLGTIRRMLRVTGADPTVEQVQRYYATLRRQGLSYSYATYICVAMERFMEMLGRPMKLGRIPKPAKVLKVVLSEAEIALFINAAKDVRTKAILAVLAFSGVRNTELCKLKIEDVDIGGNTLHISGKGAKDRKACVTGTCMEALINYLQERREDGGRPTDPLFVTYRNGLELEPQDLRKMVSVYAKKAGIRKRVHPHLLRHSLATNLLKRGTSLISIRDQLGHEFLQSTLGYLHVTVEDLKTDYRRHAPCYM